MRVLLTTLVVLVAIVVVAIAVLRWWKVRHDTLESQRRGDQHLIIPPPSPYTSAQGFRLVDGESPTPTPTRPAPPRPRLDERDYVFGAVGSSETPLHTARHDSHWALERITRYRRRRRRSREWMRAGVVTMVIVLAAGYVLQRGHGASPASPTTTWPTTFVASAHGSHAASLSAPALHYVITVTATSPSQVVIKGVAVNYFHGSLAAGQSATARVKERVAIFFDPASASVTVGGSSVTLPAGASAPYVLRITPTG